MVAELHLHNTWKLPKPDPGCDSRLWSPRDSHTVLGPPFFLIANSFCSGTYSTYCPVPLSSQKLRHYCLKSNQPLALVKFSDFLHVYVVIFRATSWVNYLGRYLLGNMQ